MTNCKSYYLTTPQAQSDAQQLFGLPHTEEVLEKFTCTLVQTYSCRHNAFTGPREVQYVVDQVHRS